MNNNEDMKKLWDKCIKFVGATFGFAGLFAIFAVVAGVFVVIGFFIFGFYYNLYDTFKLLFV